MKTLTVKDVADRYGVGEHVVLSWISSGQIRAFSVGRKLGAKKPRWRISEVALEEFELIRLNAPPQPKTPRRKRAPEVLEFYK